MDLVVCLANAICETLLGTARVRQALLERLDRDLRRDLAGLRAAHAVGDDEHRRARERVVLVVPALPPGVGSLRRFGRA